MLVITVARKPLDPATPTVAQNALRHGTGGINVDATRIDSKPRTTHAQGNIQGTHPAPSDWGKATAFQIAGALGHLGTWALGRWPANLILSHLPQCKPAGTKKIKKPGGDGKASTGRNSNPVVTDFGGSKGNRVSHYAEDETETVQVYDCQPGCPVTGLDDTTGHLHARISGSRPEHYNATSYHAPGNTPLQASFTDSGGASRFFKVIQQPKPG